jgi:pyrimidine-nucleoside phosphorylase
LGAGREVKESQIDLAAGIVLNKKVGNEVSKGDVLAYIHSNDESKAKEVKKILGSDYDDSQYNEYLLAYDNKTRIDDYKRKSID